MQIDRDTLSAILRNNIVRISFVKSNGEHRTGRFTLVQEHLPPAPLVEEGKPKKASAPNTNVLAVFDLDKSEWRSFRLDSLKGITVGDHNAAADPQDIPS